MSLKLHRSTIIALITCYLITNINIVTANDFPSLLVTNATMAIILDHDYLDQQYEQTLATVKKIVERVIREDLTKGGITVKYYSWTQINFNKDFTVVLSVSNCKNTWNTFYRAQEETLLLLAITDSDCPRLPRNEAIMIPLLTIGQELPQILYDIRAARVFNWKTATLLYDNIFDRDTAGRVITALSTESPNSDTVAMSISIFKMSASDLELEQRQLIRKMLTDLPRNFIGRNFFVITTVPNIVLEVAAELNMLDTFSQWVIVLPAMSSDRYNISTLSASIREGGNVVFATNTTVVGNSSLVGLNCHLDELLTNFIISLSKMIRDEDTIFTQISDEEWEAIRMTKRERRDSMLTYIKDHLSDDKGCSSNIKWTFRTIETWGQAYNRTKKDDQQTMLKQQSQIQLTESGQWSPTNGLTKLDELFPHITHGFRQMLLPIATFHNPPWQIIKYSESGAIAGTQGLMFDILNELAAKLNFSYVLYGASDSWNFSNAVMDDGDVFNDTVYQSTLNIPGDLLNLLTSNKVFLGAVGVTVNEFHRQFINFTQPISIQSYAMLIARPKELSRLYLFTAPFTWDTWLCLAATILLIGPVLCLVNYYSPFNEYYNIVRKGGLYKIGNCFWYIYGALLQQGGMYLPKSDSGRLIIGTWWLVVLVVVTTYCGNLVAFLTFPKIATPISTVKQLLNNKNTITWGLQSNTYLDTHLKEATDGKYKALHDNAIRHSMDLEDVIRNVRYGRHIYIDWKMNLEMIMKKEFLDTQRCDFGLGEEEFLDEQIAMIMPPNSPYLELINRELYRMLQMGFIQKWMQKYMPKKDRCMKGRTAAMEIENHTVNMNDMQGCFLVLITGIIVAIILVFCECCVKKHQIYRARSLIKPFVK